MAVPETTKLAYPRICALLAREPTRLSLAMHSAGFAHLGLPFTYTTVNTEDTASAIAAMREQGIRGYSLTIPHKENAVSLVDSLSADAREIGAVNTIVNDGKILSGFNTDWKGILRAFAESQISVVGKRVAIFGAGGAARAAIYACKCEGAKEILIWNRTAARGETLKKEFGVTVIRQWSAEVQSTVDLFVNATPVGSHLVDAKSIKLPLETKLLRSHQCVFDMVTKDTELLRDARRAGAKTIAGSRMLLFQAVEQFRLFTEQEAPVEVMDEALKGAL